MTINDLINDFYNNIGKADHKISFDFENLDHSEPCSFTRFNSFLLNQAEEKGINKLIVRYPANPSFVMSLVFYRTISNLASGHSVTKEFDPKTYENKKVKIGSSIVVFKGFRDGDFKKTLDPNKAHYVAMQFYSRKRNNTLINFYPFGTIPLIEPVSNDAKLSPQEDFEKERNEGLFNQDLKQTNNPLAILRSKKAAKSQTTILITDVNHLKDFILGFTINREPLPNLVNISHFNRNGKLISLNGIKGAYPQIILANNISNVVEGIRENESLGLEFKSIYIDLNYVDSLDEDLDYIDELISQGLNFYLFLPENKDFDFTGLDSRDFYYFAWQPSMISPQMVETNIQNGSLILQNFRQNNIQPIVISDEPYTNFFTTLHSISKEIDEQRSEVQSLYCSLLKLLFFQIRSCSNANKEVLKDLITHCKSDLGIIKQPGLWNFLPNQALISSMIQVLNELETFAEKKTSKQVLIEDNLLPENRNRFSNKSVCFIVPEDNDLENIQGKLEFQANKQKIKFKDLEIKTEDDFLSDSKYYDYVIIVGWLNKTEMKRILFSNKSRKYLPILYRCEYKWFKQSVSNWDSEIQASSDLTFMDLEPNEKKQNRISVSEPHIKTNDLPVIPSEEIILQDYRSKKFNKSFTSVDGDKLVDAIPIAFNDGTIGYYTLGFDLLKLDVSNEEITCRQTEAQYLKENSLVLMRDSSKDILEELTKQQLGDKSTQILDAVSSWKRVIQNQLNSGMTEEQMISALRAGGITVSDQALKIWLDPDNGMICPQTKESLSIIGKVFSDSYIIENLDNIWNFSRLIKGMHIQIGKSISETLSQNPKINQSLSRLSHDHFSFFAIQVDIPSVGKVSILKITDIDSIQRVPRRETNRRR